MQDLLRRPGPRSWRGWPRGLPRPIRKAALQSLPADAAGGRRLAVKLHSALRLQNGAPARHGQQTCRDRRSLHGQMACSPQRVAPGSDGTGTWLEAGPTHGCSVPGRGTTAAMAFLPTCRHPESGATASREGHSGNAEGTNANGHPHCGERRASRCAAGMSRDDGIGNAAGQALPREPGRGGCAAEHANWINSFLYRNKPRCVVYCGPKSRAAAYAPIFTLPLW